MKLKVTEPKPEGRRSARSRLRAQNEASQSQHHNPHSDNDDNDDDASSLSWSDDDAFDGHARHASGKNKRAKKAKDKSKDKETPKWISSNLLQFPGYTSKVPAKCDIETCTLEWMAKGQFVRPVLLVGTGSTDLGYGSITVEYIRQMLGPDVTLRTIDVNSQNDGPIMSLDEWYDYWVYKTRLSEVNAEDNGESYIKHAKKLLNVVSLSLANTELEKILQAPDIVQKTDLVRIAWPEDCLPKPKAELYALMSPKGCYTDWHVDFGGSSVWYHVISGSKYFALAPPTPHNLKAFAAWASSSKQSTMSLLPYLKDPVLYSLTAGQTMLIPGGWPHAVYTPSHSLVVGGNFLHPFNLRMQLEVWRLEDALRVPPKCRFPLFKTLMWHVADYCHQKLKERATTSATNGNGPSATLTLNIKPETPAEVASTSNEFKVKLCNPLAPLPAVKVELKEAKTVNEADVSSISQIVKLLLTMDKAESGLTELVFSLKEWFSEGIDARGADGLPSKIEDPLTLLCDILAELKTLDCLSSDIFPETYKCDLPEPVFNEEEYNKNHVIIPKRTMAPMRMKSSALSAKSNGIVKSKKSNGIRDRLKKKLGWRR